MEILLTVAVMYGITFGLKDSKLLSKPRQWLVDRSTFFDQLFGCAYCTGFHSGWLTYLLMGPQTDGILLFLQGFVVYAFAGTAISGACEAILLRIEK